MRIRFHDVEVDGRRVDVTTAGGRIEEIGPRLTSAADEVIDGEGGALLPGLHDHHLHLLALAARRTAVDCSTPEGLASLANAAGEGWLRGVGYHESVAGPLDRDALDRLVPGRPVRVQHRGGALWMLNSRALDLVAAALDDSDDVERDQTGRPTGRLWRYDQRLRAALPSEPPDLSAVPGQLATHGITGVTDATPDIDREAVDLITREVAPYAAVLLLGASGELPPGVETGPYKLLLRDHDLPSYADLRQAVAGQHARGRPVAVHCVTRESLLLTLAVLRDAGPLPGDRVEHGSVVPAGIAEELAAIGTAVVTQPGFVRLRGDDYLRDVEPDDLSCLYPYASLRRAGVRVASSSDAPFGDLDPWRAIRDAATRRTARGRELGVHERVPTAVALSGYLSHRNDPGGAPRRVTTGAVADLCLLRAPLAEVLRSPSREYVRGVAYRGVFRAAQDGPDSVPQP